MGSLRNRLSSRRPDSIPNSVQCGDPGLSRKYFTRKHSSKIRTNDVRLADCVKNHPDTWSHETFTGLPPYSLRSIFVSLVAHGTKPFRFSFTMGFFVVFFLLNCTIGIHLYLLDAVEGPL